MSWSVIIEHDLETDAYTATVAGLPDIIVDAPSEEKTLAMAQKAIRFYLDEAKAGGVPVPHHAPDARVVTVDV